MAGAISPFLLALSQEERIKLRSLPLRPTEDSPESPPALTVVVEVVVVVVVVPGYIQNVFNKTEMGNSAY